MINCHREVIIPVFETTNPLPYFSLDCCDCFLSVASLCVELTPKSGQL